MEFKTLPLEGLLLIKPDILRDDRGYLFEAFNHLKFLDGGLDIRFLQDNESKSAKSVVRGLHLQVPPYEQGKLVRVVKGSALDVAVDIRKSSPTYGKWVSVMLSGENKQMFWIPPGFAHGFVALENETIFFYKCTNIYNKESERSIIWNDPDLGIDWGVENPIVAEKDKLAMRFRDFVSPF